MQTGLDTVSDFMVGAPVIVQRWHPVSLLRHKMLENSFTYVPIAPIDDGSEWLIVSDAQLFQYLHRVESRSNALGQTLANALDQGLGSEIATFVDATSTISGASNLIGERPLLVQSDGRVVGIVTAFDML